MHLSVEGGDMAETELGLSLGRKEAKTGRGGTGGSEPGQERRAAWRGFLWRNETNDYTQALKRP